MLGAPGGQPLTLAHVATFAPDSKG
jgi:hypothetical protein